MQSIENKIIRKIYGKGRGWSFSQKDFMELGSPGAIDLSLARLNNTGKIRRIARGLYDYPAYSQLLECQLSPDLFQTAHALARKFNWQIQPNGAAALNKLGLSNQVPGKIIFLSDGPKRSYDIMGTALEFKKTGLKASKLNYPESEIIVQALKALEAKRIDEDIIKKIRKHFSPAERKRILKDTKYITGWIYEIIKKICNNDED